MGAAPSSPEQTVRSFVAAWNRLDMDEVLRLMSQQICYHNIPLDRLVGKESVAAYFRQLPVLDSCTWQVHALAVDGANVLTERTDEMVVRGCKVELPVMGIFLVEDGLIREWRDYFDLASYRAQWPAEEDL